MNKLGNNLKKILDERGLKSKFVAAKLNISPSYFSSIIKGDHIPSIELALRLEDILQIPINKMFYHISVSKDGESNE
jgi:transcriptional regulator with XRE-family HTH domain